jgi:hypothetical protein
MMRIYLLFVIIFHPSCPKVLVNSICFSRSFSDTDGLILAMAYQKSSVVTSGAFNFEGSI